MEEGSKVFIPSVNISYTLTEEYLLKFNSFDGRSFLEYLGLSHVYLYHDRANNPGTFNNQRFILKNNDIFALYPLENKPEYSTVYIHRQTKEECEQVVKDLKKYNIKLEDIEIYLPIGTQVKINKYMITRGSSSIAISFRVMGKKKKLIKTSLTIPEINQMKLSLNT